MAKGGIAPKKSLGQNFLIDKNVARKIVESLDLRPGDCALEIGPGTGALTETLLEMDVRLAAVEIDERAVRELKKKFKGIPGEKFLLVHDDFLRTDLREIARRLGAQGRMKAVGNIPYYISSQIIFKMFDSLDVFESFVIMIQREVARRLVAGHGGKDYGILSIAAKLAAESRILFDVPPSCFFPPPEVTSSVVKLDFKPEAYPERDRIMDFVRAAFSTRRKMLSNSLKSYFNLQAIPREKIVNFANSEEGKILSKRAEQLSLGDFIAFYNTVKELKEKDARKE
ncbi:MAG: 16S rRNA (adenine(1518)-N(6)/adenine(1519)-N(6))-dimethyltransferase RsmA [Chloroflexota bacterium]